MAGGMVGSAVGSKVGVGTVVGVGSESSGVGDAGGFVTSSGKAVVPVGEGSAFCSCVFPQPVKERASSPAQASATARLLPCGFNHSDFDRILVCCVCFFIVNLISF